MPNYTRHDTATSNVLAWTAHAANAVGEDASAEAGADTDEPPDRTRQSAATQQTLSSTYHTFQKTTVHQRPRERTESLLTRALQSQSEDETADQASSSGLYPRRRRSITSNTSMASTAGCTSDTGITTPPRTNSPSPRLVNLGFAPVHVPLRDAKGVAVVASPTRPCEADSAKLSDQGKKAPETMGTAAAVATETVAAEPQAQAPQRKRLISFACASVRPSPAAQDTKSASPAPPASTEAPARGPDETPKAAYAQLATPAQPVQPPQLEQPAQLKRPCIRFACPARPSTDAHKPQLSTIKADGQENRKLSARKPSPAPTAFALEAKPSTPTRKLLRANSSGHSPRSATRSSASRRSSHSPLATRAKRYYNAGSADLNAESSRFHEFASDAPLEDDWIRDDKFACKQRITIDDTLQKELAIRRLGKEAEEEAEQEEDEEDGDGGEDGEDGENEDDEEDEDEDEDGDENDTVEGDNDYLDDGFAGYSSGDDASDGYNTDNENGFASSDDEDDGLVLWSVNQSGHLRREHNYDNDHSTLHQGGTPVFRRLSVDEHSDSSGFVAGRSMRQEIPKNRELVNSIRRAATPELPDSTDFVCGTFDEDRPLEEAYLSHMEARKRGKLHVIPQDIDPSFPTSDPDDDSDSNKPANYKKKQQQKQQCGSTDDPIWEMDDLHHEQTDRQDLRRKKKAESPKRYHSPPPPKARGRSPAPRRMFSPGRRHKSPAPKAAALPVPIAEPSHAPAAYPAASPVEVPCGRGRPVFKTLAFRPGLTQTKSLPRPSAIFRHQHQQQLPQPPQQQQQQQQQQQPPLAGPAPAKSVRRTKATSAAGAKQGRHVRGAIDIVKGLEQKRQRRKEKFQQKYCNRARKGQVPERRTQRGEGAERMREVGLFMAGKMPHENYVLSI